MDINKVLNTYYYTHMPYVYYDDNMPQLIFTAQDCGWWKLYHFDGNNIKKIDVGLNIATTDYHHCQPTCYKTSDGIYHVSFCIQLNGKIYLYYSESTDILKLAPQLVSDSCCAGCVTPWYIVIAAMNRKLFVLKKPDNFYELLSAGKFNSNMLSFENNNEYKINFNRLYIARCNYIPGVKDKLLISWSSPNNFDAYGSVYIDLAQNKGYDIVNRKNEPLYKLAIDPLTEEIYYGKKIGNTFEERILVKDSTRNIKYIELLSNQLKFE